MPSIALEISHFLEDCRIYFFFFVHVQLRFADVGTYIKIFLETFSLSLNFGVGFFCKLFRIIWTKYWVYQEMQFYDFSTIIITPLLENVMPTGALIRQNTVSMLSWSSFDQHSAQYSFQATGYFPT